MERKSRNRRKSLKSLASNMALAKIRKTHGICNGAACTQSDADPSLEIDRFVYRWMHIRKLASAITQI